MTMINYPIQLEHVQGGITYYYTPCFIFDKDIIVCKDVCDYAAFDENDEEVDVSKEDVKMLCNCDATFTYIQENYTDIENSIIANREDDICDFKYKSYRECQA